MHNLLNSLNLIQDNKLLINSFPTFATSDPMFSCLNPKLSTLHYFCWLTGQIFECYLLIVDKIYRNDVGEREFQQKSLKLRTFVIYILYMF